jgi:hypothetical protein
MGSTKCKGGLLQDVLQLNQNQLPKPKELLTQLYNVTNPRAKHAPSGFHPTWTAFTGNLTTQALKDKASDASPSGILNTCLSTPHNDCSIRYSVKHQPINHITMKT